MNEENMKNYSIGLDNEEENRLDKLSTELFYSWRSAINRGIILAVFKVLSDSQIYDLIRFGYDADDIEVTITINRK